MKINTTRRFTQGLLLASSLALTVCRLKAVDLNLGTNLPPVTFHGFVSEGFLASTKFNYLDSDSKSGSFRFTEAGLTASMNPFPRTHFTVQGFLFDVGDIGRYEPVLDYASLEYTFNDYLGLRGGRIRRPQGIYNSIADVDVARTFVLLPQGIYDCRQRDFLDTLDGASFFGALPMGKAGNLSYELYGGVVTLRMDGGIAALIRNQLPSFITLKDLPTSPIVGGQFWWETPVDGLRFGFTALDFPNTETVTAIQTPGGPVRSDSLIDFPQVQGSAEYLWKNWTFQSEYSLTWTMPHGGPTTTTDSWYASAAYRFNKWLEAGTYYTEYYLDTSQRGNSLMYQKDTALALRFDLRDRWVLKAEGHYLRGTGLLQDNAHNPNQNGSGWFMIALKTTFSF